MKMKACDLGYTSALLVAITILSSGSNGDMFRNCIPEGGSIHTDGNTIYIQPEGDPKAVGLKPAARNLYIKKFIFMTSCNVSVKSIALKYFGSCSAVVTYGSDNRILEALQVPYLPTRQWHDVNVSLTGSASATLQDYMKRNTTTLFTVMINAEISTCHLYGIEHKPVRGLTVIAQGFASSATINKYVNNAGTSRPESTKHQTPSSDFSTTAKPSVLLISSEAVGTVGTKNLNSALMIVQTGQPADRSSALNLVTPIVISLVMLGLSLCITIVLLLVRSGGILSNSSHPCCISVRKSKKKQGNGDQVYENRAGTDAINKQPTGKMINPIHYSAIGPGHSKPTDSYIDSS
ncbi:uncharacterized protein LOC135811670 [Sycon ciliatum]|uniref:uncharacterized protein LOC135811670 n=1 Tax=Sycon ciliatum TaxID=27933 RepID=UPI0031F6E55E